MLPAPSRTLGAAAAVSAESGCSLTVSAPAEYDYFPNFLWDF